MSLPFQILHIGTVPCRGIFLLVLPAVFQYVLVGTGCNVYMLLKDFELDFAWYIFNYLNIKLAEIAFKHSDINKTPAPIGGKKGNICPCWGQVVWG